MKSPLASALVTVVFGLTVAAAPATPSVDPNSGVRSGVPTREGEFAGTWIYANRDAHYALWIRSKDGKPQVKLQYQSLAGPESFETDWSGLANYYMAGSPAEFALSVDAGDADQISGRWAWELTAGESARVETAKIFLQRTGYGRTLSMNFKDFQRTISTGSMGNLLKGPVTWTWIKVSKRELLWEELPW